MSSSSTTSAPVKRACDSCHRRKVKCIGEGTNPCKNCVSAGLACTYNAIPQKKGPKGSRAKVLSELRESQQRQSQLAAGFPLELGLHGSATIARTPGLLPPALIETCLDFFFNHVYPSQPVLHRHRIQDIVMGIEHSTEAYCMIASVCAYVMIQANMIVPPTLTPRSEMAQMSNVSIGHVLLEEAVRVRRGVDYIENPTHLSCLTSYFFYGCYFGLDKDNTAWTYLREATTQAQLLGLHDEDTYKNDPLDMSRKRVLFWLLFIAERTHALHKHRPISLYPTIHTPSLDENPSDRQLAAGFNILINLYKSIDDNFIATWNKIQTNSDPTWLAQLQQQITDALPVYLDCNETQMIELRTTQQWLRTMVWQLCVSQGFVSSMSTEPAMTFKYPLEISRDLLSIAHQFSQQTMESQGVGLIEKLFDVACCLTDVMACIPFSPSTMSLGPREYLSRFLTLISTLHNGQTRYPTMLLTKISELLPNVPLPHLQNIPTSAGTLGLSSTVATSLTLPSNTADLSGIPAVSSPGYPSTELIRQLAAQTGAQLPMNASQQHTMLANPVTRVEDLALYDSSAPHSTSHSTGSAPPSQSATPNHYEPSPSSSHSVPQSHLHAHTQHLGVNPNVYDPRFATQGFGMGFQEEGSGGQAAAGMYVDGNRRGGAAIGGGRAPSGQRGGYAG